MNEYCVLSRRPLTSRSYVSPGVKGPVKFLVNISGAVKSTTRVRMGGVPVVDMVTVIVRVSEDLLMPSSSGARGRSVGEREREREREGGSN